MRAMRASVRAGLSSVLLLKFRINVRRSNEVENRRKLDEELFKRSEATGVYMQRGVLRVVTVQYRAGLGRIIEYSSSNSPNSLVINYSNGTVLARRQYYFSQTIDVGGADVTVRRSHAGHVTLSSSLIGATLIKFRHPPGKWRYTGTGQGIRTGWAKKWHLFGIRATSLVKCIVLQFLFTHVALSLNDVVLLLPT